MKRDEPYMDDLRPIVYLVGIGMGGEDQLTGRAMDCLEAAQVVMGAAYISAGILLAVTGRHCVADTPIYIAGAVITAGCMAALAVFESRLSRELAG